MYPLFLTQTLAEKLAIGTEVALMGIAIVFAVLSILWGVLEIFRVVFYDIPRKRAAKAAAPAETSPIELAVEPENGREEELIAAITAAVALATEKSPDTFRVVSFRRTGRHHRG